MKNKYCIAFIGVALIIKFFLLAFQSFAALESKFQPDSYFYLETGAALFSHVTPGIPDPRDVLKNGKLSTLDILCYLPFFMNS